MLSPEKLAISIEQAILDPMRYTGGAFSRPYVLWYHTDSPKTGDIFVLMLREWLEVQKRFFFTHNDQQKEKSTTDFLTELFGTTDFSGMEIEAMSGQSSFHMMAKQYLSECRNEEGFHLKINSMIDAEGVEIKCKTGDVLYYGKAKECYFLISQGLMRKLMYPISKDIKEMLFEDKVYEVIRRRPGMYIGSTGKRGFYHLVFELIEDLLKDALKKEISIHLHPQNTMEIVCESYHVKNNTIHLNTLVIANAVSSFFNYEDEQEVIHTVRGLSSEAGVQQGLLRGIKLIWQPDQSIFGNLEFDYLYILQRMHELAALNPYKIRLSDQTNQNVIEFSAGISVILKRACYSPSAVDIYTLAFESDFVTGHAAISFSGGGSELRRSYVNSRITENGGTHEEGIKAGILKALSYICATCEADLSLKSLMNSVNYVIHLNMTNASYYGATKSKLDNAEVRPLIEQQTEEQLSAALKTKLPELKEKYPMWF